MPETAGSSRNTLTEAAARGGAAEEEGGEASSSDEDDDEIVLRALEGSALAVAVARPLLEALARAARLRRLQAGALLCEQGGVQTHFWVVASGVVEARSAAGGEPASPPPPRPLSAASSGSSSPSDAAAGAGSRWLVRRRLSRARRARSGSPPPSPLSARRQCSFQWEDAAAAAAAAAGPTLAPHGFSPERRRRPSLTYGAPRPPTPGSEASALRSARLANEAAAEALGPLLYRRGAGETVAAGRVSPVVPGGVGVDVGVGGEGPAAAAVGGLQAQRRATVHMSSSSPHIELEPAARSGNVAAVSCVVSAAGPAEVVAVPLAAVGHALAESRALPSELAVPLGGVLHTALHRLPCLRGVAPAALLQLVLAFRVTRVPAGAHLFREFDLDGGTCARGGGEAASSLFCVEEGELEATTSCARAPKRLGRGSLIGEVGLMLEMPRSATVRAVRDTVVHELRMADFGRFLRLVPRVLRTFTYRLPAYSISLFHLLRCPLPAASFARHLAGEFSGEMLEFWAHATRVSRVADSLLADAAAAEAAAAAAAGGAAGLRSADEAIPPDAGASALPPLPLEGCALAAARAGAGAGTAGDDEDATRLRWARAAVDIFVRVGAPKQVNLDRDMRQALVEAVDSGRAPPDLFARAALHTVRLMEGDSFLRFKRGSGLQDLVTRTVASRYGL